MKRQKKYGVCAKPLFLGLIAANKKKFAIMHVICGVELHL